MPSNTAEYNKIWYIKNRDKRMEQIKKWQDKIRRQVVAYKAAQGCRNCPENDPVCLDFHHRDGSSKEFTIALAVRRCWSFERIMLEIKKCDVLCANCHRKYHATVG